MLIFSFDALYFVYENIVFVKNKLFYSIYTIYVKIFLKIIPKLAKKQHTPLTKMTIVNLIKI